MRRLVTTDERSTNTAPAHGQVTAGATLNFQAWFCDPANGGTGFNLSDAVPFLFAL